MKSERTLSDILSDISNEEIWEAEESKDKLFQLIKSFGNHQTAVEVFFRIRAERLFLQLRFSLEVHEVEAFSEVMTFLQDEAPRANLFAALRNLPARLRPLRQFIAQYLDLMGVGNNRNVPALEKSLMQLQAQLNQRRRDTSLDDHIAFVDDSLWLAGEAFFQKAYEAACKPFSQEQKFHFKNLLHVVGCLIEHPDEVDMLEESKHFPELSYYAGIICSLAGLKKAVNTKDLEDPLNQAGDFIYQQSGQLAKDLILAPKLNVPEIESFNTIIDNTARVIKEPFHSIHRDNLLNALLLAPLKKSSTWAIIGAAALTIVGITILAKGAVIVGACLALGSILVCIYKSYKSLNRGTFTENLCPEGMLGRSLSTILKTVPTSAPQPRERKYSSSSPRR